jgi:putative SOS response-associated peptidase YedK
MAEHKCKYDIEIGQLTLIVRKMDKLLTDNGHDGLPTAVTKLNMKVDTLNERLEKMDTSKKFNITTAISLIAILISTIAIILKT